MRDQLALDISLNPGQTFETFWPGENTFAINLLKSVAAGSNTLSQIYLSGDLGIGKTHLVNALCKAASDRRLQVTAFSAKLLQQEQAIEGLETMPVVCLEDLDTVVPDPKAEYQLFKLINARLNRPGCLVMTAAQPHAALDLSLPDLRTRLATSASFALKAVADHELAEAVNHIALARGLQLEAGVIDYLLQRYSRDLSSLVQQLERLDSESLQRKRRVTIPFLKDTL